MKKALKQVIDIYKFLTYLLVPFIIVLLPVIPVILFKNDYYAFAMLLTAPVGMSTLEYFWSKKLDTLFNGE